MTEKYSVRIYGRRRQRVHDPNYQGGSHLPSVELRGFGDLKKLFNERNWPFPYNLDLNEEISAGNLAEKLDIPVNRIEIVFINGIARGLDCKIRPGDRVAFVPPGTPGPYRVILGFVQKKSTS
ncbi:MAG TPA: MoaD/ThiS family protein [Spirochaetia bacterium]|nr:MoaD/ThiS family protein [Spirochaetia bacterium]